MSSVEARLIGFIDRNLSSRFSPEVQKMYATLWKELDQTATIVMERTIEAALDRAKQIGQREGGMQTLITGSLHLVSGALYLLKTGNHYSP